MLDNTQLVAKAIKQAENACLYAIAARTQGFTLELQKETDAGCLVVGASPQSGRSRSNIEVTSEGAEPDWYSHYGINSKSKRRWVRIGKWDRHCQGRS